MNTRYSYRGFTLIEILMVVAIIGILATVAWPSFMQALIRSDRADGRQALFDVQMAQERFRGTNATYTTDLAALGRSSSSERGWYTIEIDPSTFNRGTYVVTATAKGKQAKDAMAVCRVLAIEVSLGGLRKGHFSGGFIESNQCW